MRERRQSRAPVPEIALLGALVGAAAIINWFSGRSFQLVDLARPFLGGAQSVSTAWRSGVEKAQDLATLERDNQNLKARVAELEREARAREEALLEHRRLLTLLKLPLPAAAKPATIARVIGRNPDNWHQRLILGKGEVDGLRADAVVMSGDGLVGRVLTAAPHTALVSVLTDPASSVSVINARTRAAGVIQGRSDAWPVLRFTEQPDKWRVGDRLLTSGLGGIYPKGIHVGTIVKLQSGAAQALFADLRVQPAAPLDRLEEVVVMPPGIPAMPTPPPPSPKPSASPGASPTPAPSARPSRAPGQGR